MLPFIIVILFIFVYLFDYKPVLKNGNTKEKILHGSIMAISFCILMLHSMGVSIPSPSDSIEKMIHAVLGI